MKPQLPIKHTSWTGQEDGQGKIGEINGGGNLLYKFFLFFLPILRKIPGIWDGPQGGIDH